jgi:hypothetical protein
MARPVKQGLDYFPMDVELDDKFELIEAKYGITGFGVLIKLYQRIYKEGYYIKLSEELLLIFSKRINVDINKVNDIINDCIKYNIFNKEMFDKFNILTSTGIQKRFISAVERRKDVEMIKQYIIVDINLINDNINLINTDISTQSKVKESKVKKSKRIFIPPKLNEVEQYFEEKGYKIESAGKFFEFYSCNNWKDSNGKQVMNWKQKANAIWFKDENKINYGNKKNTTYEDIDKLFDEETN